MLQSPRKELIDLDFDQIYLTDAEIQALRQSAHNEIPLLGNERLKRYKLVDELYSHIPGRMPIGKGRFVISDHGQSYLIFLDHQEQDRKEQRTHDWKVALFSTIGGALLSDPLWETLRLLLRLLRGD